MSDLIDREELLNALKSDPIGKMLIDSYNLDGFINAVPSAEPEQRAENAHWIKKPYLLGTSYFCSVCGNNYGMAPHAMYKFCPNCGARMGDNNDK